MLSAFELFRLLAAFATIFVVIPWLAFGRMPARAFVHAAFFLQVTAMVMGDWKLYLPGSAVAVYLLWSLSAALIVRRRQSFQPAKTVAKLIHWLETRPAVFEPAWASLRGAADSPVMAALGVIAAAVALRGAWFALHNVRLYRLESYSRAISLHTLMRGDLWDHDPSVALLAPVAWLSGLMPDEAIRFSGALVGAALTGALGFSAWRRLRSATGAVFTAAIFAGLLFGLNLTPTEPGGAEWSAIFVILAAGLAGEAWGAAALSLLTAALIHLGLSPLLLLAAFALTLASLTITVIRRLPALERLTPALAALAVLMAAIVLQPRYGAPEHQYEAAARVAHQIAGEFRTNDWLVVSPGLEVAQTYGRGWHVELADFVNTHSELQVADEKFRFPYAAESLFVFVEKRVLQQPAFSFAHDAGATPYYYTTRLGRASLEFRAARLMAAYMAAHHDATAYYEDDDLLVYRVKQTPQLTAAAAPR